MAVKPIDYSQPTGVGKQVAQIASGVAGAQPYLLKAQEFAPQFAQAEAATAGARATAESDQVAQRWGDIYAGLKAAPGYGQSVQDWEARQAAGSRIYGQIEANALADLARGGQLDPWQQREASQAARAAFQDRGLATGRSAALAEVLNRANLSEARRKERETYAAGVAGQAQGWAGNNINVAASQLDPYSRMFGKGGSQATGALSSDGLFQSYGGVGASIYGANTQKEIAMAQIEAQKDLFDKSQSYDKWATMYNAAASNRIANMNAASAAQAGQNQAWIAGGTAMAGVGAAALMAGATGVAAAGASTMAVGGIAAALI